MNNETLSIKFTNLTSVQKATLQQMFAYLQECTRQGASRNIGFFWDAGWGMHGKVISEEITSCKIPLTPISSSKDMIFFDLSDGQTRKAKLKFNETDFINPWFEGADLKGCPFCGSRATLKIHKDSYDSNGWSSVVRCKKCHAEVWGDEDKAITKWNKRTNSDIAAYKAMEREYKKMYETLKTTLNALKESGILAHKENLETTPKLTYNEKEKI